MMEIRIQDNCTNSLHTITSYLFSPHFAQGIPKENVCVIDNESLQDGMDEIWPSVVVSEVVKEHVLRYCPESVCNFLSFLFRFCFCKFINFSKNL